MGCAKVSSSWDLWKQYRDQFPVTQELIYLNHAAVSPLCRPAAEAMKALADDALSFGSLHYGKWVETYANLRVVAARLIGALPSEIALVKNTSEGLATIAAGLDWRVGDRIVGFAEEFPANYMPWKQLERSGVTTEWLSTGDSLDRIDEACRGARLLSISFVQYLSGFRANLEAIGEICHRHDCLFIVDAIQGLGAFPLDVRKAHIHALAADGHKWMMGPEGCGILYVQQDLQDAVEPLEIGWTNFAKFNDYGHDMTFRPDAARYECGTLNTIGCYGLHAAIDFVLSVGVERIGPCVQALGDCLAEGARSKGYEVLGTRTPESGAGIVSIRKHGLDCRVAVSRLKEGSILAAPRVGWIRMSPHFYISPDDIERVIEALP